MQKDTQLLQALTNIGLSEKEAAVYLALLSLESSTAYRIAEKCNVKKPTVYVILEDLRAKGLVLKVPHPKKALFSARSLEEYLFEHEQKIRATHTLLPLFSNLRQSPTTNVFFFSGLKGMQDALAHKFAEMQEKTYISFYCSLENTSREVRELYDAWDKKAIAHDTHFKVLRARKKDRGTEEDDAHLTKEERAHISVKYIENALYPGNISFEVGTDFIRITDAHSLFATIIDDPHTALAMRQIFTIIWEQSA